MWPNTKGSKQSHRRLRPDIWMPPIMLDANTVIFSAVKNGHSDIFIYKIEENKR
jgi:hypothetical protein